MLPRRRNSWLERVVVTSFLFVLPAAHALPGQSTTTSTTSTGTFTAGSRELFALDLSSTPVGSFPANLRLLRGKISVATKDGVPMLKAAEPSEFLVTLPAALPENFTIEFGVIPKACCNPSDLMFEGTAAISRSPSSAHVEWHPQTVIVVGGGDYYQQPMPQEVAEILPSTPTDVNVSVMASGLTIYTNGKPLHSLPNRKFAHGRVLRVALGGQDDSTHAVYLSRLRIAGVEPGAVAAAPATTTPTTTTTPTATTTPTTTPVTAVTTTTTTTATGMVSASAPSVTAPTATAPLAPTAGTAPAVATSSAALDQGMLVGTGMSDITGPIADVVMMGYADGTQKAGGLHTRLYARAFIFANPKTNRRVVWVSAELAMLFSSLKQGVLAKLTAKYGSLYTDQNVMLSATHTHSGPGGYSHHTIYNFSIGGVVKQNYDAIVDGITEAISQAHDRLAPGNVSIVSHDLIDSTMVNRSKVAFMLNPEALAVPHADEINRDMTLLKIFTSTRAIGAIAFHAVHNTSMPQYNRLVSADHKGYAAYLLEKANGSIAPFQKYGDFVAAFPNGAEGDMSPNINTTLVTVFTGPSPDPFESSKIIGTREFNAAFGLFNSTQAEALGSDIDYRHKFVSMSGTPVPSSNFTNGAGLKTLCTGAYGVSFMAGAEDGRTGMLSEGMAFASNFDKTALDVARATVVAFVTALMPPLAPLLGSTSAEFMAASADQCQFPKPIILPTGFLHWSPEILPFQMFRIGSLAIVGVPGEMTMQAGRRLQDAVRAVLLPLGVQHVLITGLANEYSGYITTPEEFVSQQYEGASTLFGRLTFDAYKEAFRDLGVAMASGKEVGTGPLPPDLSGAQFQWAPKVDHDEVPVGQTFGQILRQPVASVTRGSGAEVNVIYRSGNPRNNLRRNDTHFRIERDLGGGNWGLAVWDGTPDTKLYWSPSAVAEPGIGPGCPDPVLCYWSTIRIVWNVPADATPGRYRIRFFGAWKSGTGLLTTYEGTSNVFAVQ